MPAPQPPPSTLAALSDKEQEILRLLTAGHTVKTIAMRLGRSEASINERLRDARRKTGVGSSRELARLLAAQKIRDKKIDLHSHESRAERPLQPRNPGRLKSKGTLIMIATLSIIAAGLLTWSMDRPQDSAIPDTAQVAAPGLLPLAGAWSVDVSRIPVEERPRRVTMEFNVSPDQKWTTIVEITNTDGLVTRGQSTATLDGDPAPVTGSMHFVDTVSLRQPAPNTLVMTLEKGGVPHSTRVYTVAKDRKSMTETIVWPGTAPAKMVTNHFNRSD